MSDNFCLPKSHLLIILCVFMGLTVFYFHFNKNKQLEYNQMILNHIVKQQVPNQEINNITKQPENIIVKQPDNLIVKTEDELFLEKRKILENRDAQVKYNDFKPPERRDPEHAYPDQVVIKSFNNPTRGYPDNYQMMGVLLREDTETAYNLFGRQTYPGSNQYEYYAQGNMHYNNVKLTINVKGGKELYGGELIKLPGNKGEFKVELYKFDVPRYNPYQF